jgi:membrane fusion protein (multidrug efflux system)
MKKKIFTGVIVVVIIFLIALPKLNLWSNGKEVGVGPVREGSSSLPVEALVIKTAELDSKVIVTGSIQANEMLELKSETSGKITNIYFREGKPVKKGEVLVQVNDDEILAQVEKQKHTRTLSEGIEFRQRKLLEKDAISQEEYDNALTGLKTTEADIRLLEAQLEKTKIKAPFDGMIGLRYVSEGAYITPSTNIATLYSMNPAKIEFAVPGRYSTQVRPGQKIQFTVESDSATFQGEVYAVEPQIDQNTRTLRIRSIADNRQGRLLPGQFVKVELILESISDAILVPTEAVIPELNGHKVYVFERGKAKEVKVLTGIRSNLTLEIVSGLNPNDTLITTGVLQLQPGIDVQITKLN